MLIVLGGLPGTGKTTLARCLARRLGAVHLRIDTIEQSLRSCDVLRGEVGPAGYVIATALAEDNLRLGTPVVADCVNPLDVTRAAWRAAATRAGRPIAEVEVVCSDAAEHRRRVETRASDIAGLALPTWDAVMEREYAPWDRPPIVLDSAAADPEALAGALLAQIASAPPQAGAPNASQRKAP